ncbi:S10 family serine carboxypeptidase-like protein [Oceanicaulis sp.]|uniref:S10 family serine carboxypeptidase-like protein n=1 Tax=Oceanicaulis sp. TaxID=1924941 RepID=UPI003F71407F
MTVLRSILTATVFALGCSAASAAQPVVLNANTEFEGVFGGQAVRYQALVERTEIEASDALPAASLVTTAYLADTRAAAAERPVLFLFNGGPGAPSSWLHMGALGPVRINAPRDPQAPVPEQAETVANPHTLLDIADLVFIDPPATGFSRVTSEDADEVLLTVWGDAQMTAQFITDWLEAHDRAHSPVYVMGESYGTIRASVVAGLLAETRPLDGVILMGQAVNMIETSQRADNIVSYATNLASLAAIAAYHGRVDPQGLDVAGFVDQVHDWAMTDYLMALSQGSALRDEERNAVARQLHAYTGVPAQYYLDHRLTITKAAFRQVLLADTDERLAVYDARYTAPAPQPGERPSDPFGPVSSWIPQALTAHFSETLSVPLPMNDYHWRAPNASDWRWLPTGGMGGPFDDYNYASHLEAALAASDDFAILIGTGRYDTTTTLGPARYLADHLEGGDGRIWLAEYEGGHMAYTNPDALAAMSADLRRFLTR